MTISGERACGGKAQAERWALGSMDEGMGRKGSWSPGLNVHEYEHVYASLSISLFYQPSDPRPSPTIKGSLAMRSRVCGMIHGFLVCIYLLESSVCLLRTCTYDG